MKFKLYKKLLWSCLFVVVFAILLAASSTFLLPYYIQTTIIPDLAEEFNLEPREIQVRHVGWWGTDLGPLRFDARQAPVLNLAVIQVDYSPWSLLHRRIKGITLGGVELVVESTSNGLIVAGQNFAEQESPSTQTSTLPNLETLLPVQLDYLRILQSQVLIESGGRRHLVPFEGRLETAGLDKGLLQGRVDFSIFGNRITAETSVDQPSNSIILKGETDHLLLTSLSQTGLLPGDLKISGTLDLHGRADLRLDSFAFSGFEISGHLNEAKMEAPWGGVRGVTRGSAEPQPINFTIEADNSDQIRFNSGAMMFTGPVDVVMNALQGELNRGESGWSFDAQADTLLPGQSLSAGLSLKKELTIPWKIQATQNTQQGIEFKVSSKGSQPVIVDMESLQLSGETFQLDLSGAYADRGIKAEGGLSLGKLKLANPEGSVVVPSLKVNGSLTMPLDHETSKAKVLVSLADVRTRLNSTEVTLPDINFSVNGQANPSSPWNFKGSLSVEGGQLQDKALQVSTQGLSLTLPFTWPPAAKVQAGQLDSGPIQWKGRPVGNVSGRIQQVEQSFEMSLTHRNKMLAGLEVFLEGRLNVDGVQVEATVPSFQTSQDVDLGRFVPEASGVKAGGQVAASGNVKFLAGHFQGDAQLKLDQGSLTIDEHDLHLSGIDMSLHIADLAALKSAPKQLFSVAQLKIGDVVAENLEVDFQIESPQTLFLEKVGLQWCRGKVNAAALRITTEKEDYDVVLFCDRLDLAMLLQQFGLVEAGGQGTVNGKLPIRWVDGRLIFASGFLYSTPGQTGLLKMKGADVFLAGVPPGTPQHTQLDIATEALKDYNYQWAKLSVESENENLLLKLQLDGKPNRLLPFSYDQELGQFKRVTGEGQAEFKEISIDLNLKTPLNDIINYRELLNNR